MIRSVTLILVLAASIQACKSNKKNTLDHNEARTESIDGKVDSILVIHEININSEYQWPRETDAFNILETSIKGDILEVTVEYGGGCREHVFKMNSTGAWMKSMPPKMNLWLEHENNDDNCRALIREKLQFNLKPLRYQSSKQVVLIINGEEEKTVNYNYN